MTSDREREQTRIVRSWLQDGSTALPDRVLDAVLSELPSTPQQRRVWSLWRSERMKPLMSIGAVAAVVLVAVALGTAFFAPGLVGGPAETPTTIGGQVTFPLGSDQETVSVTGSAIGSSIAGTAEIANQGSPITIELQCSRQLDATTWVLGGEVATSSTDGQPVGTHAAVIVRAGDPQQAGLWFEDPPATADCATFVAAIPADAIASPGALGFATKGELALPAALSE